MNYEEMSDFEINLAVMKIAKDWKGGQMSNQENSASGYSEPLYIKGAKMGSTILWFDPCNNPEDAWPIIIEHHISLECYTNEDRWLVSSRDMEQHIHKNPLRAAMIVYLMMVEQSK